MQSSKIPFVFRDAKTKQVYQGSLTAKEIVYYLVRNQLQLLLGTKDMQATATITSQEAGTEPVESVTQKALAKLFCKRFSIPVATQDN